MDNRSDRKTVPRFDNRPDEKSNNQEKQFVVAIPDPSKASRVFPARQKAASSVTLTTMTEIFNRLENQRLPGKANLAVYTDLKIPYAHLAICPTQSMAANCGLDCGRQPFTRGGAR